jgi:hypothetical protein
LSCSTTAKLSIAEIANLFGFSEEVVLDFVQKRRVSSPHTQSHFTIAQLASRWQCSRGTVYNVLRTAGARVVNLAPPGKKRGKKLVPVETVEKLERQRAMKMP